MLKVTITQSLAGGWDVKLSSAERDVFMEVLGALKEHVNDGNRIYDPARRLWHVDQWGAGGLQSWVAYCCREYGAKVDWRECGRSASSGSQRKDPPPPPPHRTHPTSADAYQALHLLPSAPPEVVKAAYRALAQKHHPDHSGDTATMQKINTAFDLLSKQVAA